MLLCSFSSSKFKSEEVERELRIMLKPRPDIQAFSRLLFTAQSIVLVSRRGSELIFQCAQLYGG